MKYEELIKEIYFVAGMLEGLSCCLQRHVPEAVTDTVSDCVDRLELVGAQMVKACDPVLVVKGPPITAELLDRLSEEKKVIFRERRPEEAFGRVYPPQENAGD